ncbi:Serine/threonine-protein kinase PrkC [Novipirellula galeiformis]|uniref:non-specific serine/threonine protein kinase n=1 Tax=Novipirellula galeiformis TaxID=2528004 RepID=A0A5C6CQA0_9BACT|nr:serine/threonine-protein kinase [Novipirellula galeiformis]TWU26690.1 Serine/threonine-protein kinase PrkC [Novipirellula galeiformis]
MAADESIRTDASTVYRGKEDPIDAGQDPADSGLIQPMELHELAEARTVIRGSSRANADESAWNRVDRTPASVANVLLGKRLNHFLLEDFIGGGGMGAVFRAHDEQLDRTVAIKVIPFVGDDPDLKRRFRNEAQSAAKLDHPRIAKVFDVGTYDDWHYIVFEYIQGTNIRDLVNREGVMSADQAVFFTCQLADAIQHASDRGIVHRDIKPSNVLIGEGETIKLVDMGLARSDNFELSEDMTASGVTLGTFDYISPEQANDPRDADVRSDIYSLGCTLYFMLAGQPPYPGGTMLQKLINHGKTPPPDVRQLRSEVSGDLAAVIQKMLAKRPQDRYQNANDLIADLQEVARREGFERVQTLGPVTVSTRGPLVQLLEHHAPWLVAFALLMITAGWLYVASGLARDDFAIVVPERNSVVSLSAEPGFASSQTRAASTPPSVPRVQGAPAATRPEAAAPKSNTPPPATDSSVNRDAGSTAPEVARLPSDPPRMLDLPVPEELGGTGVSASPTVDAASAAAMKPGSEKPPSDAAAVSPKEMPVSEVWKPRAIRVSHAESRLESDDEEAEDYAYVSSLDQAIKLSKDLGVDRIELAEPLIRSGPIKIDRDGLVISSSVGGSVILFDSSDSPSMRRVELFDIGSNRIDLEDLHLVWSVPVASMGGGCLLSLKENRLVRLTDCSLTIKNPVRHPDVYAVDIMTHSTEAESAADPSGVAESSAASGPLPLVSIEMYNVCIRGEMSMLRMDVAAELQMRWENGLLAVTGRMIDTAGAVRQPPPSARPIQLLLDQVIAMVPRGLVRMRLNATGPFPLPIDRDARNCVFVVNPDTAVVEVSGIESLADETALFMLRGEANAYDTQSDLSDPMLRLVDVQGQERIVRMVDLKNQSPAWAEERSPRWAVDWASENLKTMPASRLGLADFRQYGAVISGFDERSLTIMTAATLVESNEEN